MRNHESLAARVRDRLDRPLDDLRISVIDRCNFRCSFCMPAGHEYTFLPKKELLSFEEITELARIFVDLGVTKIRLTGGEPLLRREIETLIAMLTKIEGVTDLALTTNGALLAEKAKALKEAGLKRVTVSLPSLDQDVFATMNGLGFGVDDVLRGIEAAADAGLGPIKINAIVMKGVNDAGITELARFSKERRHIVRFIEYMDVGTVNGWDPTGVVSAREIVERINAVMPIVEEGRERPSDVALRFRYVENGVEVGAIASVTEPFCGNCSRARLSADGKLYTCLFAARGHDLKTPLRGGASRQRLTALIRGLWAARNDRYSEEREAILANRTSGVVGRKVEMFRIGG